MGVIVGYVECSVGLVVVQKLFDSVLVSFVGWEGHDLLTVE